MLCPKCGKESKGLCVDCYLENTPIERGQLKLSRCSCGRFRYRGNWSTSLENLDKTVKKSVRLPSDMQVDKVEVKHEIKENNLSLDIMIEGEYKSEKFKKELNEKIKLKDLTCPTCSRKFGGYFEAILQFRCKMPDLKVDEDQIVKTERVKGGIDYYVMSNNYAKGVASRLKRSGFKIKASKKIYSRRDGREVYRVSYSIKG